MKKSNKITFVYVAASVLLFVSLLIGGVYGIYLSVGINFMRSTVSNVTDVTDGPASNVSYGASANFQPSMIGVIILSAVLILISIFYFISLIKQLILFKQFKLIRESKIEHAIEKKVKSKSSVLFFAFLLNILAFIAGIAGIFININTFVDGGMTWVLYLVDGIVSILAVVSIVMLIQKLRINKKLNEKEPSHQTSKDPRKNLSDKTYDFKIIQNHDLMKNGDDEELKNIDIMEYVLLKLKSMKEGGVITSEEYNHLRENLTGLKTQKKSKKTKSNKTKIAK